MNYRHAFHAGNHGDVLKHAVLARVLNYLMQKDAALAVLDAHAGIGAYDVTGLEAIKTGEWRGGIGRLLAAQLPDDVAALLLPYLACVKALNAEGVLRNYPGSPAIAAYMLRDQDRVVLNELHPDDVVTLSKRFAADKRVRITALDALVAVKAELPFAEKRGLLLVDPAYEVTDESARVGRMLAQALRRMQQLCIMLWYPVTTQAFADAFCAGLDVTQSKGALRAELHVRAPGEGAGLAGSGVVIVNPPWTLHHELEVMLPMLAEVLGEGSGQGHSLTWLAPPR